MVVFPDQVGVLLEGSSCVFIEKFFILILLATTAGNAHKPCLVCALVKF